MSIWNRSGSHAEAAEPAAGGEPTPVALEIVRLRAALLSIESRMVDTRHALARAQAERDQAVADRDQAEAELRQMRSGDAGYWRRRCLLLEDACRQFDERLARAADRPRLHPLSDDSAMVRARLRMENLAGRVANTDG